MTISVDTNGTLRRYLGGWLSIICRHCEHESEMPVEQQAERIGWDSEIDRPRRLRLKCSKCGNKSPALTVSHDRKPAGYNRHYKENGAFRPRPCQVSSETIRPMIEITSDRSILHSTFVVNFSIGFCL
jgi:hypothetical protein